MKRRLQERSFTIRSRHLLFVFVFVSLFSFMAYTSSLQIDSRFPYHVLQNVSMSNGTSVDGDRDGIIDNAEFSQNSSYAMNAWAVQGIAPSLNYLSKGCIASDPGLSIGDSYTGWTQLPLLINNENICADFDGCSYNIIRSVNGAPTHNYGSKAFYQLRNTLSSAESWVNFDDVTGTNGDTTDTRIVVWSSAGGTAWARLDDDHSGIESSENSISVQDADSNSDMTFIFCD